MTINLGKEKEIGFHGPVNLNHWEPPRKSAVYAVMVKGSKEGFWRIIYVGESENLADRGFNSHHPYPC